MNRTSWDRILNKYSESIGPGKRVIVIFKTAQDPVSGIIKEIDEGFLVLENEEDGGIAAIVELEQFAGFRAS